MGFASLNTNQALFLDIFLERFQVATFSQMIQTKCIAKCAVHRAICKAQKHKVVKDAGELSIAPQQNK